MSETQDPTLGADGVSGAEDGEYVEVLPTPKQFPIYQWPDNKIQSSYALKEDDMEESEGENEVQHGCAAVGTVDTTCSPFGVEPSTPSDAEKQKAVEEMDAFQNGLDALNEKAAEEILKVEQKYNKLRKPHFDRRNDLIKKIPNFWATAFVNHPQVSAILDEEEEECLHYLTTLEVEEFDDIKSGYHVKFHFDENPFFENDLLIKEFHLSTSGDSTSTSTEIKWKEGMDLTNTNTHPLANGKKRPHQQPRTFFTWFSNNNYLSVDADNVAKAIKEDLWHRPREYFLVSKTLPVAGGKAHQQRRQKHRLELKKSEKAMETILDSDYGHERVPSLEDVLPLNRRSGTSRKPDNLKPHELYRVAKRLWRATAKCHVEIRLLLASNSLPLDSSVDIVLSQLFDMLRKLEQQCSQAGVAPNYREMCLERGERVMQMWTLLGFCYKELDRLNAMAAVSGTECAGAGVANETGNGGESISELSCSEASTTPKLLSGQHHSD